MSRGSAAIARSSSSRSAKAERSPFADRLGRLGDSIAQADLSALLVTNPKDVGYLTGFLGGDSYLVVPAEAWRSSQKPVLISDFRYQEELEPVREAGLAEIVIRARSMIESVAEVLGPAPKKGSSDAAPSKLEAAPGPVRPWGGDQRIGIQAETMPVAERAAIARRVGVKRLVDTTGLISALRVIKDESEIALIRKAVRIQEAALKAVLPTIKPGQTETEIAARLEMEMKSRGSSEPGFESIVAAGANGSLPHYRPKNKKTAKGAPLLIDWGAVYMGYHSDMTRTFALGKWPKKVEEIFKVVLEAHDAAAEALAPLTLALTGPFDVSAALWLPGQGALIRLEGLPGSVAIRAEAPHQAVINEALCKGCGTCVAACPSGSIGQHLFEDDEVFSEIEGLLAPDPEPTPVPAATP